MITQNLIGGKKSSKGNKAFAAFNPATQTYHEQEFIEATLGEVDEAVEAAYDAWLTYRHTSARDRAQFLRAIADHIEALGEALVQQVISETGLQEGRVIGERGRTCGQLRMFASVVEEGSWVNAIIDSALPDRAPMPRIDHRKMLVPLGPIAVFGASNFPLAYSTAGGDTASALAAGNTVVVKGHPAHPGTNALVAQAINDAIVSCGMPAGVFSTVNGGIEVGQQLVSHPAIKAVGFTGSVGGGRALMDTAAKRPVPIPVFAEMGSTNPIFILPEALEKDIDSLAQTLVGSVTLGAGQFCTNPGLMIMIDSPSAKSLREKMVQFFPNAAPHLMLNKNIHDKFEEGKTNCEEQGNVKVNYSEDKYQDTLYVKPGFAEVDATAFINNPELHKEVFGAFTLAILCQDVKTMEIVAHHLEGQLTGSIHCPAEVLGRYTELLQAVEDKVGRLIFNGVPTGVEVCHAMNHGGPYPSSSSSLYTAVGLDAIYRFARPVCYQNAPQAALPNELKDGNPMYIWRTVNGIKTKD